MELSIVISKHLLLLLPLRLIYGASAKSDDLVFLPTIPMLPVIILSFVAVAIAVMFLLMSRKSPVAEQVGVVKEVLSKEAFAIDFEDDTSSVVKLYGVNVAGDSEIVDDQIFEFLGERVCGRKVKVKPIRVDTGDVIVAKVFSQANEYINALMVQQGFARWAASEAPSESELMKAQDKAEVMKVGIWNPAVRQLAEVKMKKMESGDSGNSDSTSE